MPQHAHASAPALCCAVCGQFFFWKFRVLVGRVLHLQVLQNEVIIEEGEITAEACAPVLKAKSTPKHGRSMLSTTVALRLRSALKSCAVPRVLAREGGV